jgi:hypothetical protein
MVVMRSRRHAHANTVNDVQRRTFSASWERVAARYALGLVWTDDGDQPNQAKEVHKLSIL